MSNRVAELSTIIAENTSKINLFLETNGIESLNFDQDVPIHFQGDVNFSGPRKAALQACAELQALLKGSTGSVFTREVSVSTFRSP